MAEVLLDGELVDFQGPVPVSANEVWNVLEQYLEQGDRLLVELKVDGAVWMPDSGSDARSYERIDAVSCSQMENIGAVAHGLLEGRVELMSVWNALSAKALNTSWEALQPDVVAALNGTQPVVESCGLLVPFAAARNLEWRGPLGEGSEGLNRVLGEFMDAFEGANCIQISDISALAVPEALDEVYASLSEIDVSSERAQA